MCTSLSYRKSMGNIKVGAVDVRPMVRNRKLCGDCSDGHRGKGIVVRCPPVAGQLTPVRRTLGLGD